MSITERRAREKEYRRQTILAAAEKLFARDGYHTTTLDRVAEEAELSKGTIYLYFRNKEDLFLSVIDVRFQAYMAELVAELNTADDLAAAVEKLVTYELRHSEEHRDFFRLMLAEQTKFHPESRNRLRRRLANKQLAHLDTITQIFQQHMEGAGTFPFSPRTLALCITGAISAHTISWLMTGQTGDLARARDEIVAIFARQTW
jgi:AcrR family transcriptional regulator